MSPGAARLAGAASRRGSRRAGRHEADVLAVRLVGDRQVEARRRARAVSALGMPPSGKRRKSSCVAGRGEQEIALVALGIGGAVQLGAVGADDAPDVVAGRQRVGAEIARRLQEVAELHRLVAADAGDRRLAAQIGRRRNPRSPRRGSGSRSRARNAGCRAARRRGVRRGCPGRRSTRPCVRRRRLGRRAAA